MYILSYVLIDVSLCNGDSVHPSGVVKNFNVGYISLNIRGRLLIFGIHIDHMDLYPPDLSFHGSLISVLISVMHD